MINEHGGKMDDAIGIPESELRKAAEKDWKSMLENVWGDPAVYQWMLFTPTHTEEEARRRAAEAAAAAAAASGDSSSGSSSDDYEPVRYSRGATDVSSFVSAAYGIIGSGYSWSGYNWTGSVGSSWFTCSGVVDYALGRPPRARSPETLYAEVGSAMVHSTGALNYGDLVFYASGGRYPGHVGIYIGGGQIIDAIPGGVAIRNVNYMNFIGGGPII